MICESIPEQDFRGVYRTRCGLKVRILHSLGGRGWLGKAMNDTELAVAVWDVEGKHRDPAFDLIERVRDGELYANPG